MRSRTGSAVSWSLLLIAILGAGCSDADSGPSEPVAAQPTTVAESPTSGASEDSPEPINGESAFVDITVVLGELGAASADSIPAWEAFEVRANSVVWVEQITAIGQTGGLGSPIGPSCKQLEADIDGLTSCEEVTSAQPERGRREAIGNLTAEGTIRLPAADVTREIIISGTDLNDDYCSWVAFADIEPGAGTLELPLAGICA